MAPEHLRILVLGNLFVLVGLASCRPGHDASFGSARMAPGTVVQVYALQCRKKEEKRILRSDVSFFGTRVYILSKITCVEKSNLEGSGQGGRNVQVSVKAIIRPSDSRVEVARDLIRTVGEFCNYDPTGRSEIVCSGEVDANRPNISLKRLSIPVAGIGVYQNLMNPGRAFRVFFGVSRMRVCEGKEILGHVIGRVEVFYPIKGKMNVRMVVKPTRCDKR